MLYPNDSTTQGKELRLKQEYMLVSATVQDIIRRFKKNELHESKKVDWSNFPKKIMMQLNDTHPILAIVELARILMDIELLEEKAAWEIINPSFAYTNHTVLPEALEMWDVGILGNLLPRHL